MYLNKIKIFSTKFKLNLVTIYIIILFISACSTSDITFTNDKTNSEKITEPKVIILSKYSEGLGKQNNIEKSLINVMDYTKQKRFEEARSLLTKIRSSLDKNTDGYHSITASMAIVALREGDFLTFMEIAGHLDELLGKPVRVNENYLEIITVYRIGKGYDLPVNAPEKLVLLEETMKEAKQLY